jgi:hypothetical protein
MGAELFHADGRTDGWTDRQIYTDITKLIVVFRNFVGKPKNALLQDREWHL